MVPEILRPGRGPARAGAVRRGALSALAAVLAAGCAGPAEGFLGPLPVRNQHHLELTVLDLLPRRARTLPAGRIEARTQALWTNTVLANRPGDEETFLFDLEQLRWEMPLRIGLGQGCEVELVPAFLRADTGGLDDFIDSWHDLFGLPQGLRPLVEPNRFAAFLAREGTVCHRLQPEELLVADLPLVLACQLAEPAGHWPGLLGRVGLETPLGKEADGGGNGGWDFGAGVVAGWTLAGMEVTGDLSWVRPATPGRIRRVAGRDYAGRFTASASLEAPLTPWFTALAHLRGQQGVLARFDSGRLNREQLTLWLGGRIRLGPALFLEGSVGEDLIQKVSPDVTFHLGLLAFF